MRLLVPTATTSSHLDCPAAAGTIGRSRDSALFGRAEAARGEAGAGPRQGDSPRQCKALALSALTARALPRQHRPRGTDTAQLRDQWGRPLTVTSTAVRWWKACASLRVRH